MMGDGKTTARRPMFAPIPAPWARGAAPPPPSDTEITGFSYVLSADGKYALVEFVARHPKAFDALRNSRLPDVKLFPRNQAGLAQIETEFRKLKPGFDVNTFRGGAR